ncbi:phosphohydrolase [Halosquirtibacter xylanolyticus]|uniref:HD domain-containing protein n=1 Tax=Halosquirtibacter xylanolyticus TaxID=3374599 RepID=UPI003747BA8E|nr:phosphohydrolase [Prolixibacteraceae bacterium]
MSLVLTDSIEKKVTQDIKALFVSQEGSHDWQHIVRVWNTARKIHAVENRGSLLTIFLAAMLHDVADAKLKIRDEAWIQQYLEQLKLPTVLIEEVMFITQHISFKKQKQQPTSGSINFQIVQDADRLDAIGAIGIARAFAYGGSVNAALYDENHLDGNREEDNSTLDHFYAKLFRIEEKINTPYGKVIARERTLYMKQFVAQLKEECQPIN